MRKKRIILVLVPLVILLIIFLTDWMPIYGSFIQGEEKNLVATKGKVLFGVGTRSRGRTGNRYNRNYEACSYFVIFSYNANGRTLISPYIDFQLIDLNRCEKYYRYTWRYATGREVEVFYQPDLPIAAVLEPEAKMDIGSYLGSRIIFVLGFGIYLILVWAFTKSQTPELG